MINHKFYILFIILSVLLFSTKKSLGGTASCSKYKIHANFLKKPNQHSRQGAFDYLIDVNDRDDDETSKAKFKPNRAALFQTIKFIAYEHGCSAYIDPLVNANSFRKYNIRNFLFSETSALLSLGCLRI